MKKQGFTLIELLAVIVILAVIALIATPIILNVIEESKKGSAEQSANGYKEAIENQVMINEVDSSKESIVDGVHSVDELKSLGVEVKGQEPENGNVYIEKGIVKNYIFGIGDYVVENGVATKSTNKKKYENGYAIYYNPVSGEICEESEATTNKNEQGSYTEVKTGCMKWYVFNDSKDASTVNMILDHNTTARIRWNDNNVNVAYSESNLASEVNKLVTESNWKSVPRLITAYEVSEIVGKTDWTNTSSWYCLDTKETDSTNYCAKAKDSSTYKWLFNNLNSCENYGCATNDNSNYIEIGSTGNGGTYGYWTSTPYGMTGQGTIVWNVNRHGHLNYNYVSDIIRGIRPVITISKSLIK